MPASARPSAVVWPTFVATRLTVLLVAWLAIDAIGFSERPQFRVSEEPLWNLSARWDAGWYLGIARAGYQWRRDSAGRQQNIAFFPAFPLLMRTAGEILTVPARLTGQSELWGGESSRFLLGGVGVSLLAFWWALHYLFRLAAHRMSESQAAGAVALLASYPFALFYGAPYTESLYLLTTVAAFFHLRRHQYWAASGWGLLAGLTRPNGFLLSLPLAMLAMAPMVTRPPWRWRKHSAVAEVSLESKADGSDSAQGWRPTLPALGAALTPVLGMLLFSAYLGFAFGRPFVWTEAQSGWGRSYQGLRYFTRRYDQILEKGLYAYVSTDPIDVLNVAAVLFCTVMLWPVARRIGLPYAIFVLVNLLPALLIDLPAIGRMTAVLFPVFLALASMLSSRQLLVVTTVFALVQGLTVVLFYTWRQVY